MKKILALFFVFLALSAQVVVVKSEATAAKRRIPVFLADSASPNHLAGLAAVAAPSACFVSKNGAAGAVCAGTWAEIDAGDMPGHYYYEATVGEVDTNGFLIIEISAAGADNFHALVQVQDAVISHGSK